MGELSYFLLRDSELLTREWVNHVALAALTLASLAICCLVALRNALSGRPPFAKERW